MPTLTTRALIAALHLLPDSVVSQAMTHPPRRRRASLAPRSVSRRHDVTEVEIDGHLVATARPRSGKADAGRHLVHLHGGAYTLQDQHWAFLELWLELGWTVTLVDYPLAPEHTVDQTVPMTIAAWEHVVAGAGGTPIDLVGDSAGGGLALVLLQHLRDHGRPLPRRTVLLSPWVDLVMDDAATIAAADDDALLSLSGLRGAAALYAGDRPLTDPWLSPINGGLHDLGEVQAWVGTAEMFVPQDQRLADLAAAATGTTMTLHLGHGLPHDWALFPVPERAWLVAEMRTFLDRP